MPATGSHCAVESRSGNQGSMPGSAIADCITLIQNRIAIGVCTFTSCFMVMLAMA